MAQLVSDAKNMFLRVVLMEEMEEGEEMLLPLETAI